MKLKFILSSLLVILLVTGCTNMLSDFGGSGELYNSSLEGWEIVEDGLPKDLGTRGVAEKDGQIYMARPNAIFRSDGNSVEEYLRLEGGYPRIGMFSLNDELYVYRGSSINKIPSEDELNQLREKLDTEALEYSDLESISTPFDSVHTNYEAGNNRILAYYDEDAPKIKYYDLDDGEWIDTNFPSKFDWAHSRRSILEDEEGNIWYTGRDNGTFKYDGSNWEKIFEGSASLSVAKDGTLYRSYEETPTTQINSIFKYDYNNDEEIPVHSHRGYGTTFTPFNESGAMLSDRGGRFGSIIIEDSKKWLLPCDYSDVNLSELKRDDKDIRSDIVVADGTIYNLQRVGGYAGGDPKDVRLLKMTPNLNRLPFYTANIDFDIAGYLSEKSLSTTDRESLTVRWLDNGDLATAFNENDQGVVKIRSQRNIVDTITFDSKILDMDIQENTNRGVIALEDEFVLYDFANEEEIASISDSADKKRVSISPDGNIVLTSNKEVRLYSGEFEDELFAEEMNRSYVEDVELSDWDNLVYVVGYDNKTLPSGNPVQVAYVNAYNYQGNWQWQKFGFDGGDLSNNIADTRLYRARLGDDGDLYITGESAGTKTIFRYDGDKYYGEEVLSNTDHYNDLWNTASAHISYFARLDSRRGDIKDAKLTMARLNDGESNTFRVRDIAVEDGRAFMGATSSAHIANRDAQTINGDRVGEYAGSDPSLLGVATENFDHRLAWTTFSEDEGVGSMESVDIQNGQLAVLGYISDEYDDRNRTGGAFTTGDFYRNRGSSGELPYLTIIDLDDNFSR